MQTTPFVIWPNQNTQPLSSHDSHDWNDFRPISGSSENSDPSAENDCSTLLERKHFGTAYERGYKLTQRFLISRGAPPEAAEEVAQAAWVKGWECRQQLHDPRLLGAWVNSIAKNLLKNRVRATSRMEELSPTTSIEQWGDNLFLKQLLRWCSPAEGALLRAYYVEGYTTEEIAKREGLTAVTVRVRLLRIRRALRSRLSPPHFPPAVAAA